jgi:hypothetical protein
LRLARLGRGLYDASFFGIEHGCLRPSGLLKVYWATCALFLPEEQAGTSRAAKNESGEETAMSLASSEWSGRTRMTRHGGKAENVYATKKGVCKAAMAVASFA